MLANRILYRPQLDCRQHLTIFLTIFIFCINSVCSAEPAIVYIGKIQDNTYNHSLHRGIEEYQKKTGNTCIEIETYYDASEYLPTIVQCIAKKYSPIILPYAQQFPDIDVLIHEHREIDFILLDQGDVDQPNVYSFAYSDQEGAFMAGALAALMTQTNIVGFIYTSDQYSVLLNFRAGYIQGCKSVNPAVKILESQLGDDSGAWGDTDRSRKIAAILIAQGADVLFAAAGFAGTGVLAMAAENNIHAIGVDSNQNHLHPGTMIGSMIKRSDKAVFIGLMLAYAQIHRDGIRRMGLAQDAVGIDFQGVEEGLVPETVKQRLRKLKSEIILGSRKLAPLPYN